jgi:uncharacterized protein
MNKVALVTGASFGLGLEFCKILASKNYDLIITARSEKKLDELKLELMKSYPIKVTTFAADLSLREDTKKFIRAHESVSLDLLVNNAGVGVYGEFKETDINDEVNMLELNMVALSMITKAFLPAMLKKKSGQILNLASTAAFQPGPLMSLYFATKAFVLSFSEALSEELIGTGVSVTCYCPSATRTNFQDTAGAGRSKLFKGKIPGAQEVALDAIAALEAKKTVAIYGFFNRFLIFTLRFTPRFLIPKIVKYMQAKI